jgi:phosphomannomutase
VPVMWKTGHSVMKDKMRELGAPLAGELSGHIFFADKYYGFDDALYCAIRLLNALSHESLSGLTQHLPKLFNTPEIRIEVREEEKFTLIPRILENLQHENLQISTIDGLRVTTPDGWFLLRPSNTQNVLVARMESSSATGLEHITRLVRSLIETIGYHLP